jgi:Tol biopolymer transport system component
MNARREGVPNGWRLHALAWWTGRLLVAVAVAMAGSVLPASAVDRVSVRSDGVQGNAQSSGAATSANGSCVAFYSDANNLLPQGAAGDTNGVRDVFMFDQATGELERVSVSSAGGQANGPSQTQGFLPAIDAGCECVAFSSDATNLVPDDTNQQTDVFVRSLMTGTTERASRGAGGEANGPSVFASVSAGCTRVAFQSDATNLIPDDANAVADIFVFDRATGGLARVNVGATGEANGFSITPSISADGACVAFTSAASNLLAGDTNGKLDIYVACNGQVTCRASRSSAGGEPNNDSFLPALSADGRLVAFKSFASNLAPGDVNTAADVFLHDCTTGTTELVSVGARGNLGDDNSFPPSISGDGRFVAFGSFASNLIPGVSTRGNAQIYVRDRQLATTMLISANPNGRPSNASAPDIPPSISFDGGFVAFASLATNLVPGDTNSVMDAFLGANPTATSTRTPTPTRTPTALPCEDDEDCPEGQTCVDGLCRAPTPTPTAIVCDDDEDCPEGQSCEDGLCRAPTPTATPTPPIPCFDDLDCPQGQVCEDEICVPAPTPTPTIACDDDRDCPSPLVCIAGVCRDLSTPTPTPTPLPTCVVDEDCLVSCTMSADCRPGQSCVDGTCNPADHCRAMVCVPPRVCDDEDPAVDRLQCRGERETCLNDLCECGGDCNIDGYVFGNEITLGVNILGGLFDLSVCPAADMRFPPDGEVMGNEITLAVLNLGLGCPGEGQPLELPRVRTDDIRTLVIGSGTAVRGGRVTIGVSVSGGEEVATTQMDLLFDTTLLSIGDPSTACTLDPRLAVTHELRVFLPQRPPTPAGTGRVRLFVGDLEFPVDDFGDGPLFSCTFEVNPLADLQTTELRAQRLNIGDRLGNQFIAAATSGGVTIVACAGDQDCPEGRVCRDGTCVMLCEDDDDCPQGFRCDDGVCTLPCETPTQCRDDLRETCINGFCECTGDCNGDDAVFGNEVTVGVRVGGRLDPTNACPAADANGDGEVRDNEITLAVINLGLGCPDGGGP